MALTKAQLIDLNGNELILDLDADTSITADTDDQIDIKIAGADDFRFTANTFTALSGSSIVTPTLTVSSAVTLPAGAAAITSLDIDGATDIGAAIVDADLFIIDDGAGGTNRKTTAARIKTYIGSSTAADDLTIGDAAVLLTTSAGNITIDAAGNDTDIIFKGTDGNADTVYMTIDGSAGGDLFLTGGLIDLKNDGSAVSQIKFYCESSNAHAQTLIGAPHSESATNTLTLPDGNNGVLLSTVSTATVTNKTFTSPKINEDVAVTSTATEINLIDGGATVGTTAIADGDGLLINDAGTMRVSTVQTLSAYLDDEITSMPNLTNAAALVTVSALDTGSITPGFGAIDNGAKTIRSATITAETAFVPDAQDGAALGTTSLQFSDLFLADGAVIGMGDDNEVTLTHVHDTGLLLSSTDQLQFGDSGTYIHQSADGVLDLVSDTEIEINATTIDINGNVEISGTTTTTGAITSAGTVQGTTITATTAFVPDASDGAALGTTALEFSDLFLADGAVIALGDDQEVTITHNHNVGIIMLAGSADDGCRVSLQTRETTVVAGDRIGDIDFKAPLEGSGTDAILTCARIRATAEGTFAADNNATSLQFFTAASEESVEKMTLTSAGILNTNKLGVITDHDLGVGLHVRTADSGATVHSGADELVLENAGNCGLSILSSTDGNGKIGFGDSGDNDIGAIIYDHAGNSLSFKTNAAVGIKIDSAGIVTKPLQPLFKAQQTGALSVADGHTLFSGNTTEAYDVNADYNNSGTFTAPVSGYYQFSFTVLYKDMGTGGADDAVEDQFISSNLTETGARWGKLDDAILVDTYGQSQATTILFMDASDTCYIKHTNGGTMAVHVSATNSHFEGHLLQ